MESRIHRGTLFALALASAVAAACNALVGNSDVTPFEPEDGGLGDGTAPTTDGTSPDSDGTSPGVDGGSDASDSASPIDANGPDSPADVASDALDASPPPDSTVLDATPPPDDSSPSVDSAPPVDSTPPDDGAPPNVLLTVNYRTMGGAGGTLGSSNVTGIQCSSSCQTSASFPQGSTVDLELTGASSSAIESWTLSSSGGGCTGTTCSVTMSSAVTVSVITTATNIAFVTSQTYAGDFGGPAAANGYCATAAKNANLPGTFVTWLGTNTSAASTALGSARGWIRPDGLPIADTLANIEGHVQFYSPVLDELGGPAPGNNALQTWTGAYDDGSPTGVNCSDWSSSSSSVTGTSGYAADPFYWSSGSAVSCDMLLPLYCFATDLQTPTTPPARTGRLGFLSTGTFAPSSSGIAAADGLCQSEGAAVVPAGTFVAFLALQGASPASRINQTGSVWQRPDGVSLAASVTDFANGTFLAAPTQTSNGTYSRRDAWAGALSVTVFGGASTTCGNWLDPDGGTAPASTTDWATQWFGLDTNPCTYSSNVICLQN